MIAPTAAMSLILLLLGGIAALYLHRLQQKSSDLLSAGVVNVEAAEELATIAHKVRNALSEFLLLHDPKPTEKIDGYCVWQCRTSVRTT
jgi:hypothetical protein